MRKGDFFGGKIVVCGQGAVKRACRICGLGMKEERKKDGRPLIGRPSFFMVMPSALSLF